MKEIPMLFSTPMVQAELEGRKTMTRRIVDVPDLIKAPDRFRFIGDSIGRDFPRPAIKYDDRIWYEWQLTNSNHASWVERCRWKVGDLLWVRENFRVNSWVLDDWELTLRYEADGAVSPYICLNDEDGERFNKYWVQSCDDLLKAGYTTNEEERFEDYDFKALRLRPNIFLPKVAARIWLQVTDIRVERLQDISEQDAIAEGVEKRSGSDSLTRFDYRHYYYDLWDKINGPESWQANPWVWVVSFKVLSTTGKPDLQNLKAIA